MSLWAQLRSTETSSQPKDIWDRNSHYCMLWKHCDFIIIESIGWFSLTGLPTFNVTLKILPQHTSQKEISFSLFYFLYFCNTLTSHRIWTMLKTKNTDVSTYLFLTFYPYIIPYFWIVLTTETKLSNWKYEIQVTGSVPQPQCISNVNPGILESDENQSWFLCFFTYINQCFEGCNTENKTISTCWYLSFTFRNCQFRVSLNVLHF